MGTGCIVKKHSPVSFVVQLNDGPERRCHIDQIQLWKRVTDGVSEQIVTTTDSTEMEIGTVANESIVEETVVPIESGEGSNSEESFEIIPLDNDNNTGSRNRYPARIPDRFY